MGITASIKGYHFIRKGVMMVIENEDAILSMTKGLYPDIAKEYNTTAGKVERAMRHAIETAWKRTGKEIYSELAGYSPMEKPTNSQFIAIMSEYLRV
jgi:two-component system response regulator (stage 0 sporulation protein A)